MNQSFEKYKNLWISINSIIEDQPQNIQNKFNLFEDPMDGFDNKIDYNGEYGDLLSFKNQIMNELNQDEYREPKPLHKYSIERIGNFDLKRDIKKIKDFDEVFIVKSEDHNIDRPFILDVNDGSYFYTDKKERDDDEEILSNLFDDVKHQYKENLNQSKGDEFQGGFSNGVWNFMKNYDDIFGIFYHNKIRTDEQDEQIEQILRQSDCNDAEIASYLVSAAARHADYNNFKVNKRSLLDVRNNMKRYGNNHYFESKLNQSSDNKDELIRSLIELSNGIDNDHNLQRYVLTAKEISNNIKKYIKTIGWNGSFKKDSNIQFEDKQLTQAINLLKSYERSRMQTNLIFDLEELANYIGTIKNELRDKSNKKYGNDNLSNAKSKESYMSYWNESKLNEPSSYETKLAKERAWLSKYAKYIDMGTYPEDEFNSEKEFYDDVERTEKMIEYLKGKTKSINQSWDGKSEIKLDYFMNLWSDLYGEYFDQEYPGVYDVLSSEDEFKLSKLEKIWKESYGENFKEEYNGIYNILKSGKIQQSNDISQEQSLRIFKYICTQLKNDKTNLQSFKDDWERVNSEQMVDPKYVYGEILSDYGFNIDNLLDPITESRKLNQSDDTYYYNIGGSTIPLTKKPKDRQEKIKLIYDYYKNYNFDDAYIDAKLLTQFSVGEIKSVMKNIINEGAGVPNKKFAATLMIPIEYSQDNSEDENYWIFKDLKERILDCLPNDFREIGKHINHYNLSNGDYVLAEGAYSYLVAEEDDYANLNLMFVPNFNEEDYMEGDDVTYEEEMKNFKDEVNQTAEKLFKEFKGHIRMSKGGYTSGEYKGQPIAESKEYKIKMVNISEIKPGDIILHNGKESTVSAKDIKQDKFMGKTIFGDSYALGNKSVALLIYGNLNESQNQSNINSPREYLNSLFGKRIDPKDYEKINNNVVSKFGSSVINLFASTEGADKVDNATKYQQYFKSNQKIMESKLLNEAKVQAATKIDKEELLDNFYFMFKNQHKDQIANKESIKYSDIKEWFASAYKSDQINFKEFYQKFRDDDSIKVVTESEVETFEDGDVQKIDQIFGTMKKIKDGITDASRKIDDFVESDSNIDKLACKIQEGLNAGYSNIDNMLEQLDIELGYQSKQKLVENLKKKNIPVFETDPMNLQIGSTVTNESGIVGKIFDIQENRIAYQSGAEIITESNESVYLIESEMNQSDEQELERKYKQDKIYLIENWDKLFELLNLHPSEYDQGKIVKTFDKLEGDNDQRPNYSIMEIVSDALDDNHIMFNYNELERFFNR